MLSRLLVLLPLLLPLSVPLVKLPLDGSSSNHIGGSGNDHVDTMC